MLTRSSSPLTDHGSVLTRPDAAAGLLRPRPVAAEVSSRCTKPEETRSGGLDWAQPAFGSRPPRQVQYPGRAFVPSDRGVPLPLTQTQLASAVADRAEITRSEAKRLLGVLEEIVLEKLGNAQKVRLGGLVQLTVRVKPAQKAL